MAIPRSDTPYDESEAAVSKKKDRDSDGAPDVVKDKSKTCLTALLSRDT